MIREDQERTKTLRPMAFRPHLAMKLTLLKSRNDSTRLPEAVALGRHRSGIEIGPLHDFLKKGWSEL
jgi:hypothetical protein